MFDCRYYDLCCFTDDSCNGEPECPKRDHCQFYSPMPDVGALLALADEMEGEKRDISCATCRADFGLACYDYKPNATCMEACLRYYARRIREALEVEQ